MRREDDAFGQLDVGVGTAVKRAIATMTADSLRPEDACELIEAAAAEAVAAALEGRVTPFVIADARINVEWNHQTLAEMDTPVERAGDTWRCLPLSPALGVVSIRCAQHRQPAR